MHVYKPMVDLTFNIAQLLREEVGARREYTFSEPALQLDESSTLINLEGKVRFTRTPSGVLGDVEAHGDVEMPCIRCLNPTKQAVAVQFRDEFHSKVEVTTGIPLPTPDEEDPFYISENHMVDLGEALREYALLELPMQTLCRPDCKGICPECGADRNTEPCNCQEEIIDERFAALKALLKES